MKRSSLFAISCIIILSVVVVCYLQPMQLNNLVSEQIKLEEVEEISVNVFSFIHTQQLYKVINKTDINNLTKVFNGVKVRRVIFPPTTFKPELDKTYYITLASKDKAIPVKFMSRDYIIVNEHTYKIINETNLKGINDIVDTL